MDTKVSKIIGAFMKGKRIMKSERKPKISKALMKLGVSPVTKGYYFLKLGILYCLRNEKAATSLYKSVYKHISDEDGGTSCDTIDRAIRHAVSEGWSHRDKQFAKEVFESTLQSAEDKPSNALYIAALSEWLREDD